MKYSFSHLATRVTLCTVLLTVFFLCAYCANAEGAFFFKTNLSTGTISSDVKELQKFLNTNGYTVATKGPGSTNNETTKFGALTKRALIKFQKDKNITPASGFFGPLTRDYINQKFGGHTGTVLPQPQVTLPIAVRPIYLGGHHLTQITNQMINGIGIPTPGNTPVLSTENSQYSTTIVWNGNPAVYVPGTEYTATITILPKPGYTIAGIPANFFTVAGATTTNSVGSGVVTAVFSQTGIVPLTISAPTITLLKPYDGTTTATVAPGILSGIIGSDVVTVSAIASYDTATAGTGKLITVLYTLGGAQADHYIKPSDYVVNTGEITYLGTVTDSTFSIPTSRIPLTLAPTGSSIPVGTSVVITNTTPGATIYYTTNGSEPTESSAQYSTPLLINSDTTVKTIAKKVGHYDSSILSSTYTINKSTTTTFSWPHGTVQVGDKFYLATRTNPATITVFNDPNDLTNSQTVALTGHQNVDSMVYDSIHNKLYASSYDGIMYQAPHKTTILQIDPDNIANWSVVYDEGTTLYSDGPSPIVTDGTYVYGSTYTWVPSAKFFKIRISDWTLETVRTWTGRHASHAVTLIQYSNRSEMYVTNAYGNRVATPQPTTFAKVNLSDLSYSNIGLGLTSTDDTGTTDDMACTYVNESGSICYAVTDITMTRKVGYKINTANMTVTEFSINNEGGLGSFIYNNDLYILDSSNKIIRYRNLDTTTPEIFDIPSVVPNEFFYSSSGKMFVSDWNDPSKVIEFKLPN